MRGDSLERSRQPKKSAQTIIELRWSKPPGLWCPHAKISLRRRNGIDDVDDGVRGLRRDAAEDCPIRGAKRVERFHRVSEVGLSAEREANRVAH